MCQIISVPAGRKVNLDNLDKAQKYNKDGYGVAWYEDGIVKTYKTMNYIVFKGIIKALTPYTKIVHLRHTTVGLTNLENCHPFSIPTGQLFHNGTIISLKPDTVLKDGKWTCGDGSDSSALADILWATEYESVADVEELLKAIIGKTINRLAFIEDDGKVTIINEHLGEEEDGIWYSNDYHKKSKHWGRHGSSYTPKKEENKPKQITRYSFDVDEEYEEEDIELEGKTHKVFVYGTLKRGYANHNYHLSEAVFLGKARTKLTWEMIGENKGFPYVTKVSEEGHNIKGEVFSVSDSELKRLDVLEGVATGHYKKIFTQIQYDDKTIDSVYMYVACREPSWAKGEARLEEWTG
jgi:gamma-glutamylaminecyclotransferase